MRMTLWLGILVVIINLSCKQEKITKKSGPQPQTKEQKTQKHDNFVKNLKASTGPFKPIEQLDLNEDLKGLVEQLRSAAGGRRVLARLYHEGPKIRKKVLIAALHCDNPNVRSQAALIAGRLHCKDADVTNRLIWALRHDPDQDCRAETAKAFVDLKDKRAEDALINMLKHDKFDMARANAAWALGAMRSLKAVDVLSEHLSDQATWVRLRCASALKKIRSHRAIKAIRQRLKIEKNPLVHKRLMQALKACERHR